MGLNEQTPWTDESLVQAVCGGGAARDAALQWWFNDLSIQNWVRAYVSQRGGSTADAEDLYHDTFISFDRLIREGKFRNQSGLKTFFCSIAKWQWLNKQRKVGRVVAMAEGDRELIGYFSEPDMYLNEKQQILQKSLSALGEKCKKLLTCYQLSYSMKEIALEMGYSSEQVAMNKCSECRKKLRQLIENNNELNELFNS